MDGRLSRLIASGEAKSEPGATALVHVDGLPAQDAAWIQAALVRLDCDPGRIDGIIGDRTLGAMRAAGVDPNDPAGSIGLALKARYASEF